MPSFLFLGFASLSVPFQTRWRYALSTTNLDCPSVAYVNALLNPRRRTWQVDGPFLRTYQSELGVNSAQDDPIFGSTYLCRTEQRQQLWRGKPRSRWRMGRLPLRRFSVLSCASRNVTFTNSARGEAASRSRSRSPRSLGRCFSRTTEEIQPQIENLNSHPRVE
ncbi:hypothetical protein GGR56DRAFT_41097 [Xylariaceae sp. FL0804]|nr:hypothetical protein GGR56DRAFT_41097 [Xylariaceae sp. FL0804]